MSELDANVVQVVTNCWVPLFRPVVSGIVGAACSDSDCDHRHCIARVVDLIVLTQTGVGMTISQTELMDWLRIPSDSCSSFAWWSAIESAAWHGLIEPVDHECREFSFTGFARYKKLWLTHDDAESHVDVEHFIAIDRELEERLSGCVVPAVVRRAILYVIRHGSQRDDVFIGRGDLSWLEDVEPGLRDRLFDAMLESGMLKALGSDAAVLNPRGPACAGPMQRGAGYRRFEEGSK